VATIDDGVLCVGDKVRFCFDLGGEPRGGVGTIVGIDYDEDRPYEVEWDEYTARYQRRELARVFRDREGTDHLYMRERVRYVGGGGLPRVGTVVGFRSDRERAYTVEWDSEGGLPKVRADYERRELAREEEGDMGKIETLAEMFAHEDGRGRAKEPPSVDVIERGFAHVAAQLKAERMWVDSLRRMVRNAPKGVDPNELVGLSNQVETLARAVDEREQSFRRRMRLCLRAFLAGDL
jgi:hypothetical protein